MLLFPWRSCFVLRKLFGGGHFLKQSIALFFSQMGPTYEPNSFGGPQADPKYADPAVPINVSGPGQRYENHFGKDDFMEVRLPQKLCERRSGGFDVVDVDHRYLVRYSDTSVSGSGQIRVSSGSIHILVCRMEICDEED